MADPRDVSVSELLSKIVRVMVDRPEFVVIKTRAEEEGASLAIDVHPDDIGKIIGKEGGEQCQVPPHHSECHRAETTPAICCRSG